MTLPLLAVLAFAAAPLNAAPAVGKVTQSTGQVGKYAKLELTVELNASFTNAYNPDEIDLQGEFTSPTRKVWKVNGFYDGSQWKIRFAANETGTWYYVVKARDSTGRTQNSTAVFSCVASTNHGWVKIAPNHRYLSYDDGTSFYGVGACYPWSNSTNGFDQMQQLGFNTYVYWNGTYDREGGNNLIESTASGLGRYDAAKCRRIDNLIDWSEARGLGMILVIWPHDYLSEGMRGWPVGWPKNPYATITTSTNFYADTNAWAYQKKMYRYIIARWGYSPALLSWQTIDEISGTPGWVANRPAANAWAGRIAKFFQTQDPFKHPSNASHGNFWDEGNQADDLSNTEIYGNYSLSNIVSTIHRLWNGYEKPCIMGETGVDRAAEVAHRKLWAGLASGISITPLFWSFNQGWNTNAASQFAPLEKFIAGINFAGLTSPVLAKVAVPDAGAYGINSDQLTFGWITGDISGKNLNVTGLRNGGYRVEWWDCVAGTVLSTNATAVTDGSMSLAIPATTQPDLGFKIIANP
jgi:hypothetical protein